jgi:hypothetical protein
MMWDFNDDAFLEEAREVIAAFGERYDDDPCIFAVQLGILGMWGEWHTFTFRDGYSFSATVQAGILEAYREAFVNRRVVARYPWHEPLSSAPWLGYHNDYFLANNGHSDEFDDAVAARSLWRQGPIGGEAPPESGSGGGVALYESDVGLEMIETGHYSTMAPGGYRREPGQPNYDDYMRLHRRMGYNFRIEQAVFPEVVRRDDVLSVVVRGANVGVAPMYYDWDVELALLDDTGAPFAVVMAPTRLSAIEPGGTFELIADLPLSAGTASTHQLAIRISQPGASETKDRPWGLDARNVYIEFANDITVLPASWTDQNALAGGWSVLGSVSVPP